MIYKALQIITEQINNHLKLSFNLNDDIVFISPVKDNDKVYPANRVSISLAGIERETAAGISFQHRPVSENLVKNTAPAWQINVHFLIAVLFHDKQYEESLKILSAILGYLQKNTKVVSQDGDVSLALDVVNLSVQELANLWGICGDTYYPSVLCRLRVIHIDSQEIKAVSGILMNTDMQTGLKR